MYQRFAHPRDVPRKRVSIHHSSPARHTLRDLFLPQRGRLVLCLPGLPLLAFRSHVVTIPMDPHHLPTCTSNTRRPREMQVATNPAATRVFVLDCSPGERPIPRKQDLLTDNESTTQRHTALAPVAHVLSAVLGAVTHMCREEGGVRGKGESRTQYPGALTIPPRTARLSILLFRPETRCPQSCTPGFGRCRT